MYGDFKSLLTLRSGLQILTEQECFPQNKPTSLTAEGGYDVPSHFYQIFHLFLAFFAYILYDSTRTISLTF